MSLPLGDREGDSESWRLVLISRDVGRVRDADGGAALSARGTVRAYAHTLNWLLQKRALTVSCFVFVFATASTARRVAIEKKIALREATAAEFSAVALQSYKHRWRRLRAAAVAAKARNDEFIRSLHATQQKANEAFLKHKSDLTSSSALLEQEKTQYFQKIEAVYPAWQERLQDMRLQKLKMLEGKKRAVEKRRYLAKKSHEIELSENLEKNEAYERELLRRQSTVHATRLDYTIREHARGARSFMAQQAQEHIRETAEIDDQVADTLFETFSPRRALQALKQANSFLSFSECEEKQEVPQRSINIEVPIASAQYEKYEPPQRSVNIEMPCAALNYSLPMNYNSNQLEPQVSTDSKKSGFSPVFHVETNQDQGNQELQESGVQYSAASATISIASDDNLSIRNLQTTNAALQPEITPTPSIYDVISRSESVVRSPALEINQYPGGDRIQSHPEATSTQPAPDLVFSEPKSSGAVSAINLPEVVLFPPASEPTLPLSESQMLYSQLLITETRTPATSEASSENLAAQPDSRWSEVESPISSRETNDTLPQREIEVNHSLPIDNLSLNTTGSGAKSKATVDSTAGKLSAASSLSYGEMQSSEHHALTTDHHIGEPEPNSIPKIGSVRDLFDGLSDSMPLDGIPTILHGDAFDLGGLSPLENGHKIDSILNIANSFDLSASNTTMNSVSQLLSHSFPKEAVVAELNVQTKVSSADNPIPQTVIDSVESLEMNQSMVSPDHYLPSSPVLGSGSLAANTDAEPTMDMNASSDSFLRAKQDRTEQTGQSNANSPLLATTREPSELIDESASIQDTTSEVQKAAVAVIAEEKRSEEKRVSPIEKLSMADKLKVLGALITRVEEGATEGDSFSVPIDDDGSTVDTKRELVRMAAGGRKAQINFFGSDICFELVVDIARELGPVLFPARAFEGIMSEQKIKKVHQNSKDKEPDLWKALSSHMKQMVALKALPVSAMAELFGNAFLHHDLANQRSQRKMKELLFSVCGATVSSVSAKKEHVGSSSQSPNSGHQQHHDDEYEIVSPGTGKQSQQQQVQEQQHQVTSQFEAPSLLQTAFLQHTSPPKPKTFGLGSSGFGKKKSDSQDVLKSMVSSSPAKLSHKLMRGGKMRDYSEFEEEEEVDLHNLIGSKGKSALSTTGGSVASSSSFMGGSYKSPPHPGSASASAAASNRGRTAKEDNDFDVDF